MNGHPVEPNFAVCDYFQGGTFTCTGQGNPGSGVWRTLGQSEIELSANGQSIDCSYTVSGSSFVTNGGSAGTVTSTRVTPPSLAASIGEYAVQYLALFAVAIAAVGGLILLGKTAPPSKRRRA